MNKITKYGLAVFASLVTLSSNAMAEVTYTKATGFAGDFDLAPYYSAIGMVIGVIAIVASLKLAMSAFRRVG